MNLKLLFFLFNSCLQAIKYALILYIYIYRYIDREKNIMNLYVNYLFILFFSYYGAIWIRLKVAYVSAFLLFFCFFFLISRVLRKGKGQLILQQYCSYTVTVLFMEPTITLFIKNIKNGSYSTIYTFKNYFATVFLVSATISSIQADLQIHICRFQQQ